jgi:hypothetical protein
MGKYLSIGPDRDRCPPVQIRAMWFHVMFPGNPYWENPNGSMPSHTKGHEGNLPIGTQIQSLRMPGPHIGVSGSVNCWSTFCVAFSLALFALGDIDPTGRFCLRTLNFGRPMTIVGPVWIRLPYPMLS